MIRNFLSWLVFVSLVFSSLTAQGRNDNSTMRIRLGGLFAIYARGAGETCDKTKMFKASVQVSEP